MEDYEDFVSDSDLVPVMAYNGTFLASCGEPARVVQIYWGQHRSTRTISFDLTSFIKFSHLQL